MCGCPPFLSRSLNARFWPRGLAGIRGGAAIHLAQQCALSSTIAVLSHSLCLSLLYPSTRVRLSFTNPPRDTEQLTPVIASALRFSGCLAGLCVTTQTSLRSPSSTRFVYVPPPPPLPGRSFMSHLHVVLGIATVVPRLSLDASPRFATPESTENGVLQPVAFDAFEKYLV